MLWGLLFLCTGCPWSVALFSSSADAGLVDAGRPIVPWGTWTASLPVPACPNANTLIVTTVADEPVGATHPWEAFASAAEAGPSMSFREAMWVAANHPGPDTIVFDAASFPPDAPATIELANLPMPQNLSDLCLDGRGRGVVLHWGPESVGSPGNVWRVGPSSLMVGLVIATVPFRFSVTAGGQVAGCRFRVDDPRAAGDGFFSLDMSGGVIGPGNVFAGPGGLSVSAPSIRSEIIGNYFGIDPRTRATFILNRGAMLWSSIVGEVVFRENLFSLSSSGVGIEAPFGAAAGARLVVEQNTLTGASRAISTVLLRGRIGPDNLIYDNAVAIDVTSSTMMITRNSLFNNTVALIGAGPAPTALFIDGGIGGLCPAPGLVEAFSDAADEAEHFLGDAACDQSLAFFVSAALPRGRNVTTTFTALDGGTSLLSAPVAVP